MFIKQKHRGPGPYNSYVTLIAENISGFSDTKSKESTWRGKWEKFGDFIAEKKLILS